MVDSASTTAALNTASSAAQTCAETSGTPQQLKGEVDAALVCTEDHHPCAANTFDIQILPQQKMKRFRFLNRVQVRVP
jgi:hypothetical protein